MRSAVRLLPAQRARGASARCCARPAPIHAHRGVQPPTKTGRRPRAGYVQRRPQVRPRWEGLRAAAR